MLQSFWKAIWQHVLGVISVWPKNSTPCSLKKNKTPVCTDVYHKIVFCSNVSVGGKKWRFMNAYQGRNWWAILHTFKWWNVIQLIKKEFGAVLVELRDFLNHYWVGKRRCRKLGIVVRKKQWKKCGYGVFTIICTWIDICMWKYIWKKTQQVVNMGYWGQGCGIQADVSGGKWGGEVNQIKHIHTDH